MFNSIVGDWRQMRPIWILFLLGSLTEEQTKLHRVPIFDIFLERAARGLGKNIQAIEKPSDQCRPLNKLGNEQVSKGISVWMCVSGMSEIVHI